MELNVFISNAADGLFTIKTVQMPELVTYARTLEDVEHAVRSAAGATTGHSPEDFDIIMDF